jgi:hypothetical protein
VISRRYTVGFKRVWMRGVSEEHIRCDGNRGVGLVPTFVSNTGYPENSAAPWREDLQIPKIETTDSADFTDFEPTGLLAADFRALIIVT